MDSILITHSTWLLPANERAARGRASLSFCRQGNGEEGKGGDGLEGKGGDPGTDEGTGTRDVLRAYARAPKGSPPGARG